MKTNINPLERGLRIGFGLFIMSLAFWGPQNVWFLLGVIPFATGFTGWCPTYTLLGISTCKLKATPTA